MRRLLAAVLLLSGCSMLRPRPAPVEAPVGTGLAAEAVPTTAPPTQAERDETRAGWVIGWRQMTSTAAIDDAIDLAQSAGLNALFVQVRVSGDAYYRSDLVPRAETLSAQPADFDPLDYALRRGHEKGLKIHAWMNMGIVWRSSTTAPVDPRHAFNAHPDWVIKDASGKPSFPDASDPQPGYVEENYWIDWARPEARRHLAAVVGEVATKYAVDGVHYDFVRYPARMGPKTAGVGYGAETAAAFKAETGLAPAEHTRAWDEWRVAQVTAALKECDAEVRRARPAAQISAAVLGAWNLGYGRNFTSYRAWLRDGLLDFAVPMAYYSDPGQIWQTVLNAREVVDGRRVLLGLDVSQLSATAMARQIHFSRDAGLRGYSLFALDHERRPDPKPYLEAVRAMTVGDPSDARYAQRDPLWNRVARLDAEHRKISLRFFSRTGKTKLVVYPRGATTLRFAVSGTPFKPLALSGLAPVSVDLTPWLKPFERQVVANHDFALTAELEGPADAFAEVFTVDYY